MLKTPDFTNGVGTPPGGTGYLDGMGATSSASMSLPDDACEAVLRKLIAEDLERVERLLCRADEQLGRHPHLG